MIDRASSSRVPVWAQDLVLAVFVATVQLQGTISRAAADPDTVVRPLAEPAYLGYGLLLASGLVLTVRRRYPMMVFAVTASISLVYYALDFPDGPGWLALFIAAYTLTAQGDGRRSLVVA